MSSDLGPNAPSVPIPFGEQTTDAPRIAGRSTPLPEGFVQQVLDDPAVDGEINATSDHDDLREASRDWWPIAMRWALDGQPPALAAVSMRPETPAGVAAILRAANQHGVPVTAAAGRSGVCGGSMPVHGGVVLDLCGLSGIASIDQESMVLDVAAGTFGDHLEDELRTKHGMTLGHWPQSIALSTVGGWLACRSAGQYSNRYGKIEDMVVGMDVVLADGRQVVTGGGPRAASGPDLNQVFVGSEGTLGVITSARLKVHRLPEGLVKRAYGFASFDEGNQACRRILQRGATPAVLRLYDTIESKRNFEIGDQHVLLVLDEADPAIIEATTSIVEAECAGATRLDDDLLDGWLGHRNDTSALQSLYSSNFVVDTMEVAAPWPAVEAVYRAGIDSIGAVPETMAVSCHQSHAYHDGACLYFTFAGRPGEADHTEFYRNVWDAGTAATLAAGARLSHHHGVGLNRSRFMEQALGTGFSVLVDLKNALDPNGILNPGKMGLPDPFATDGEKIW